MHADAMRLQIGPRLIGFTTLKGGNRWWSVDKEPDLRGPVVHRFPDGAGELFPGLFQGEGSRQRHDLPIDIRGVYGTNEGPVYVGVSSDIDENLPRCFQTLYHCDRAGNILYSDRLLKQVNSDIPLSLNAQNGENIMAFVRGATQRAYPPVVAPDGRVFYGEIDFEKCAFRVHRRDYAVYRPQPVDPIVTPAFATERDIQYEPTAIPCNPAQLAGAQIPRVSFLAADGTRRIARPRELERGGFVARLSRQNARSAPLRLTRRQPGMPNEAGKLCDSLANLPALGCQWQLSLSGPNGFVRTFAFAPDEKLLCARVIGIRPDSTVVVRVDLAHSAQVLLFTPTGTFLNRFTFNRQGWQQRRDVVVVMPEGQLVEADAEGQPRQLLWKPF
jgi:hypothetical protein